MKNKLKRYTSIGIVLLLLVLQAYNFFTAGSWFPSQEYTDSYSLVLIKAGILVIILAFLVLYIYQLYVIYKKDNKKHVALLIVVIAKSIILSLLLIIVAFALLIEFITQSERSGLTLAYGTLIIIPLYLVTLFNIEFAKTIYMHNNDLKDDQKVYLYFLIPSILVVIYAAVFLNIEYSIFITLAGYVVFMIVIIFSLITYIKSSKGIFKNGNILENKE